MDSEKFTEYKENDGWSEAESEKDDSTCETLTNGWYREWDGDVTGVIISYFKCMVTNSCQAQEYMFQSVVFVRFSNGQNFFINSFPLT